MCKLFSNIFLRDLGLLRLGIRFPCGCYIVTPFAVSNKDDYVQLNSTYHEIKSRSKYRA